MLATVATSRGNNAVIFVELNITKEINGKYKDYSVMDTLFSADNNVYSITLTVIPNSIIVDKQYKRW